MGRRVASVEKERKRSLRSLSVLLIGAIILIMLTAVVLVIVSVLHPRQQEDTKTEMQVDLDAIFAEAQAAHNANQAEQDYLTPEPVLYDVDGIQVDLLTPNEFSRPQTPIEEVHAVVIHYIGNPGTTARQNRDYYESLAQSGEDSVSSHFVVGLEGEIIQCIPMNEKSYCTNHRNFDTISIECCHPDKSGKLNDATRASLVTLVRYLVQSYGLDRDGVIRHYDVTGKECPLYYVRHEDEWEKLKDDIFDGIA